LDPKIAEHRGRIVKTTGDGLLVEFASVVDALRCAVEFQAGMSERNATVPAELRIQWRIGINVGDIVVEDEDIFGDGVNIAARLEGLALPGEICVSARVHEDAAGKVGVAFEDLGEQQLHNISRTVRVYRIGTGTAPRVALPLPDKPSIAVLAFTNMSDDPEQEFFADGIAEDIITVLSKSRLLFVIRHAEGLAEAELAVSLDPNSASAHGARDGACLWGGRSREAIEPLQTAMRLSPFDPLIPLWLHFTARAHYWAQDYDASVAVARQLRHSLPNFRQPYNTLIAALGQTGQMDEAHEVMTEELERFGEGFRHYMSLPLAELRELRPEDREHLIEGFCKAGVDR
jgi:pentatricopeptide repeat protein